MTRLPQVFYNFLYYLPKKALFFQLKVLVRGTIEGPPAQDDANPNPIPFISFRNICGLNYNQEAVYHHLQFNNPGMFLLFYFFPCMSCTLHSVVPLLAPEVLVFNKQDQIYSCLSHSILRPNSFDTRMTVATTIYTAGDCTKANATKEDR